MTNGASHKFTPGQSLYYKPGDFAPLQVTAGGYCLVVRQLDGLEGDNEYCVLLSDQRQERIVKERELTDLGSMQRARGARLIDC